jgi:hypothetical protein
VIPIRNGDRQWLVAPYGEVSWLLNGRAAGEVVLRRGRDVGTFTIREVSSADAGPILKQYIPSPEGRALSGSARP